MGSGALGRQDAGNRREQPPAGQSRQRVQFIERDRQGRRVDEGCRNRHGERVLAAQQQQARKTQFAQPGRSLRLGHREDAP